MLYINKKFLKNNGNVETSYYANFLIFFFKLEEERLGVTSKRI